MHHSKVLSPLAFFLLLFFTGIFAVLFLWYFPHTFAGTLASNSQLSSLSDSNFFVAIAEKNCINQDNVRLNATWGSTGVIGYLTYGCYFFKTVNFYVFLNPLISAIMITLLFIKYNVPLKPYYILALFSFLYMVGSPGKEFLSFIGLSLIFITYDSKFISYRFIFLIMGLFILYINRPHELAIFMAAASVIFFIKRFNIFSMIMIWIFLTFAVFTLWEILQVFFNLRSEIIDVNDTLNWKLNGYDVSFLSNQNPIIHGLLSPFRIFIVIASLCGILLNMPPDDITLFSYRYLPLLIRLIDFIIICIAAFKFLGGRLDNKSNKILAFYLIVLWGITFLGVDEKSRYLITFTPFLMLAIFSNRKERTCSN